MISSARPYLDLAAEALQRLDSGNRVIERCVEYLSQLSKILQTTSKDQPPCFSVIRQCPPC